MKRLQWLRRRYPLSVGDRVLHKTPLIFDVAIWEIFGPLMAGATILMADHGAEADVGQIGRLLSQPGTVFTHFVPSMLEAYLEATPRRTYPDLRWVQLSGEAASASLLARFNGHFNAEFHNLYGQTETSEVAGWESSMLPSATTVPIGRQIGIYRLYLLDEAFNPVPPGVPGEICVAGIDGLARGYLGRPSLTAEKFVPNPYALVPGEQMYRTGDLGRTTEDGLIEFVGRTDHQVKIAGCRVEVAEIEAIVLRHPTVRKCAVIARSVQYGGLQLVAYVVGDGPHGSELRTHVERHLPRYMVPSAFVLMSDLPVTASGKLDRLQLPAPSEADFASQAEINPPQTPLEIKVAAIWQDVLGLKQIGREDHFFGIGGNSLKAIQILARLEEAFNITLRISTFWTSPTIARLSIAVENAMIDYIRTLSDAEIADEFAHET
jgi:acyl-coenzyme A synthetase/AMP-(fatty) acid ligase/acyl carrier protein